MILKLLLGLLGLGIMVFVHELGHFLGARAMGIGVEVFSLGWGKRLWGFTRKGTTYQIGALPVGGYCRMKGEEAYRQAIRDRLPQFPPIEGAFYTASPLRRIVVSLAGPLANVLFAVLILTLIWWIGFPTLSSDNRIVLASDYGGPMDAPATVAGLRTGDRIVAIGERTTTYFQEIQERIAAFPGRRLELTVLRDGRTLTLSVVPALVRQSGSGRIGIHDWAEPVVGEVRSPSEADLAGLRRGDRILAVDGQSVRHGVDLSYALDKAGDTAEIRYQRDGQVFSTSMRIGRDEQGNMLVGFDLEQTIYPSLRVGPAGALREGAAEAFRTFLLTVRGVAALFSGVNLRDAFAGPVRISYYVGAVAASGLEIGLWAGIVDFFRLLCLLSVVLFVMNLLPIPALDGGQIVMFLVEVLRRRAPTPRLVQLTQLVGFAILASLLVAFTVSDILFIARTAT